MSSRGRRGSVETCQPSWEMCKGSPVAEEQHFLRAAPRHTWVIEQGFEEMGSTSMLVLIVKACQRWRTVWDTVSFLPLWCSSWAWEITCWACVRGISRWSYPMVFNSEVKWFERKGRSGKWWMCQSACSSVRTRAKPAQRALKCYFPTPEGCSPRILTVMFIDYLPHARHS